MAWMRLEAYSVPAVRAGAGHVRGHETSGWGDNVFPDSRFGFSLTGLLTAGEWGTDQPLTGAVLFLHANGGNPRRAFVPGKITAGA